MGVFFRGVLRVYNICTTARKTPTTPARTCVTIEAPETCVTYGITEVSSRAGPKNVVQIGARFWRFFCHQVALQGRHSPGFTLDGPTARGITLRTRGAALPVPNSALHTLSSALRAGHMHQGEKLGEVRAGSGGVHPPGSHGIIPVQSPHAQSQERACIAFDHIRRGTAPVAHPGNRLHRANIRNSDFHRVSGMPRRELLEKEAHRRARLTRAELLTCAKAGEEGQRVRAIDFSCHGSTLRRLG